jgi:hypothetical protein
LRCRPFPFRTDDFFKKDKQLLKEINALYNKDIGKLEWRRKSIQFLEEHQYHTDYCQLLLNSGKEANLQTLKNKVTAAEKKAEHKAEEKHTKAMQENSTNHH